VVKIAPNQGVAMTGKSWGACYNKTISIVFFETVLPFEAALISDSLALDRRAMVASAARASFGYDGALRGRGKHQFARTRGSDPVPNQAHAPNRRCVHAVYGKLLLETAARKVREVM
jgi:hypothetical protein